MAVAGSSVSWRWIRRALAGAFTAVALLALWHAIAGLPEGTALWPEPFRAGTFAFATLLGLVQMLVAARCFQDFTPPRLSGFRTAAGIFLLSQTAKYVPGRVWAPVMQKLLFGNEASARSILGANLVVLSCVVSAQVVGVVSCAAYFTGGVPAVALALALSFGSLGILLRASASLALRIGAAWMPEMTPALIAFKAVGWTALLSLTGALAWIFVYAEWLGYPLEQSVALYGISSASIIAGLISLLPAGFGVREAAFLWLAALPWPLPADSLAPAAIHGRVWLLAVDGLSAIVGLAWLAVAKSRVK